MGSGATTAWSTGPVKRTCLRFQSPSRDALTPERLFVPITATTSAPQGLSPPPHCPACGPESALGWAGGAERAAAASLTLRSCGQRLGRRGLSRAREVTRKPHRDREREGVLGRPPTFRSHNVTIRFTFF